MIGSRERPYSLILPPAIYRTEGAELGLDFSEEEIRKAARSGRPLGVKRYVPSEASTVALPIPAGAFVECKISQHVQ